MRTFQSTFARWYNGTFDRRGRYWADRFKSTLLGNHRAVLDCLLYIELNAVRARLCTRPEEYKSSSIYLREIKQDKWLMPLKDLLGAKTKKAALLEFKARLYYRGGVPTKGNQHVIPNEIIKAEADRGFKSRGVYRKRVGYFVDGIALGAEEFVENIILELRERGVYRHEKNPKKIKEGYFMSVRAGSQ